MSDRCPRCGSVMIEKPPDRVYTSNPPQWDSVMWCGCGYSENRGRVFAKSQEESLMDEWKRRNNK